MKTILIPIFQGVEALNILRTDIFGKLSGQKEIRIVLLVPSIYKLNYYKKEFKESKNLTYEVFDSYKSGFLDRGFSWLKVHLLKTDTIDIKRKLKLEQTGNILHYYSSFIFNRIVARTFFIKIARLLDYHLVRNNNFKEIFNKYQPDVVFLAHLFGDTEIAILREAKKRNIKSVGFINSWDKLTSRCILRILPDWLIVPNEITKKEAIKYHDVKNETIFISGPPQFDLYKKILFTPREEFCKNLNIDPLKKIILFCPIGRTFSAADWNIVEILNRLFESGHLGSGVHVIVRFPPNDTVEIRDNINKGRFSFVVPGVRFSSERGVDWDMNFNDLQSLADNIYHSSLAICFFSTMSIDASILNKPVINIDFSAIKSDSFYKTPRPFSGMSHYKNILQYGGIQLVKNELELSEIINSYLENPEKDSIGRKKIAEEQVWKLDGMAGERIADFIFNLLRPV